MSGFAKDGVLYPSGIYAIDDNAVSPNTGWSSQKIVSKLANVKSIIRVDEKPTISSGTVTYIKNGASYTTTDQETWFYYVVDGELYKTIFVDGEEFTKADDSVNFSEFVTQTELDGVIADVEALETSVAGKVDKVSGKGLSTNDLTSALKVDYDSAYTHSQTAHAPIDAEKNAIVGVQKNGTDVSVNSTTRKVNITVPTKTSELVNDSGFKTTDTTYSVATTSANGLMSSSDKTTLNKAITTDNFKSKILLVGTATPTTSTLPVGAWYGKYS